MPSNVNVKQLSYTHLYIMRSLELFSGTKSVGNVAETLGYEVTSLDLKKCGYQYRYTKLGLHNI